LLGKARAKKIADYINQGNVIPGALILSAQKGVIKGYDKNLKKLKVSNAPGSFLVIDGQHRLYGAHQSGSDIPLSVCIFDKLEKQQEVQYFLDVNGLQRGVPKALQLELTKFTAEPNTREDILLRLFDELDNMAASPLSGRLSRTKSIPGKLSHVPFQAGIKSTLDKSPMITFDFEQKRNVLINFLSAAEDVLIEDYASSAKLTNAAFFQALMGVFIDACNITYYQHKNYKMASFRSVLSNIAEINLDDYSGTNKKAISELSGVIRTKISAIQNLSDDLF
jgi:DNA sulfur modification protein DndB